MKLHNGIELDLTLLDHHKLTGVERARVMALQSGAFIGSSQHSKYDPTKLELCTSCNVRNDRKHWLICPLMQKHWEILAPDDQQRLLQLPDSVIYHLLVPYSPDLHRLRQHHESLPWEPTDFLCWVSFGDLQHLFTDGSGFDPRCSYTSRASWSVVNANTSQVVHAAPLHGPRQAIDRAEATAILAATTWGAATHCDVKIWSDSRSSVDIANQILATGTTTHVHKNRDLWHQYLEVILASPGLSRNCQWLPARQDEEQDDPFHHWCTTWNAVADRVAVRTNLQAVQRAIHRWQSDLYLWLPGHVMKFSLRKCCQ